MVFNKAIYKKKKEKANKVMGNALTCLKHVEN